MCEGPEQRNSMQSACSSEWFERHFENEWGEMGLLSCLISFSWFSSSSCPFPVYGPISLPYFCPPTPSLHRCDLLGAKLLPLSDLHTELLMQVPHGKLGAIFYLETFQPYTADPATAACFITHHGDVWMEINGFFTLFPRQICRAVGSLGE